MQKIKIACTSGIKMDMNQMSVYPGKLKKHSQLEIERLCDAIVNDGFLFPIAIGKLDDKNYVMDGECRLFALQELEYRGYEIPEIPIFYVKTNEKTIKRNILLAASTNHCVTETSLKEFNKENNVDLKQLAFSTPDLIDFHTVEDLGLYVDTNGGKFTAIEHNEKDYEGLLK